MLAAEPQLKALMVAALAGDGGAYRGLLAALGRELRRYYARRLAGIDAPAVDDLVQEALIALHTRRATYDRAQPFTPWLFAIARYKLADHLRRRRLRVTAPLDESWPAEDETEAALAKRDLDRLLESLPPASKDIIRKIKIEGLTTAETAAETGRSEVAIRVGLHRTLKALSARARGEDG